MNTSHRTKRGFMLSEIVVTLPLAAVALLILGKLTVDTIYLQRIAAQHANLLAVQEALTQQLRQDLWSATEWRKLDNTLILETAGRAGPMQITYAIEPDSVRRTTASGDERVWRCRRLRFEWSVTAGRLADVLSLDFTEAPPPRAATVPPRTFTTTFLLPELWVHGAGEPEAQP